MIIARSNTVPISLYGTDDNPLPLDHVFAVGDAKVAILGGAFANAVNLPTPVAGGAAGSFNFTFDASEDSTPGAIRLRIASASIDLAEFADIVSSDGLGFTVGQTVANLRVLPVLLYGIDGELLPGAHVFQPEDTVLSRDGATFSQSPHLPTPLTGAPAGAFNLQLDAAVFATAGSIRVQISSSSVVLFDDEEDIVPPAATPAISGAGGSKLAKLIAKTLKKNGKDVGVKPMTLVKVTKGTRSTSSYSGGTNPTEDSYTCTGLIEKLSMGDVPATLMQLEDDKVSILGATLPSGIIPSAGDKVTLVGLDGVTRTLRLIATLEGDGVGALYSFQARK